MRHLDLLVGCPLGTGDAPPPTETRSAESLTAIGAYAFAGKTATWDTRRPYRRGYRMDMDLLLMLAFTIASLFIIVGGIVLYPIARRLGAYLEALALARRGGRGPALQDAAGLRDLLSEVSRSLEAIEGRLDLIDDRQTFLERLVEARTPDRLVEGPASRAPDAGTPTA